jgi:zinc transport system substrate-binding protein
MLFSLISCKSSSKENGNTVITTCFPIYDAAKHLLADDVEAVLLLKPGQDSHSYDPSPKDIVKIRSCDLFICIGGQDENWVTTLLSGKDMKNVKALSLIDSVPPLAFDEGHHEDDGHDHSHAYDEHIWTSPKNMMIILETIKNELSELYPQIKEDIEKRAEEYMNGLSELDSALQSTVEGSTRNLIIFGDRFPFLHLTTDYGLSYKAAYPGCSDMTEPSVETVADLVNTVKDQNIPIVFKTQLSNGRVAKAIAEETGAKVLVLHSLTNVIKDEWESGETYYSIMTKNIEALKTALGS